MRYSIWTTALSLALCVAAQFATAEGPHPMAAGGGSGHHGQPVMQGPLVGQPGTSPYAGQPGSPTHVGMPLVTAGGYGEQLYSYDSQEPWLHGYYQEIPAYGGYAAFRPYNYKHVLSQSQAAGGWGMSPRMPYSQQFWHRYHEQAVMHERHIRP